jgi:hypothetical protein
MPRIDTPGWQLIRRSHLVESLGPIVNELCLDSPHHDLSAKSLHELSLAELQQIKIVRVEQQHSSAPDPRNPLAGYQPDLVAAVKERLGAGDRPGSGGFEPEKRDGTPKDIRQSKEEWAETYTADYIEAERKAGRAPTLTGLRQAAVNDRISGAREFLRVAFDKQYGVTRGRRKKSAE